MARLLYALSGQGRGHLSRARAMAAGLRARGHVVRMACGGANARRLDALGEPVLRLPALEQVITGNAVSMPRTFARNLPRVLGSPRTLARIERALSEWQADAVVTDFEPFAPRAARRLGLPVASVDHQHVLTHTDWSAPDVPANARFIREVTRLMVPPADVTVVTSFFFPPPTAPATFVEPIVGEDVAALTPSADGPLLVYANQGGGLERLTHALGGLGVPVVAYGLPRLPGDGLAHRAPSRAGFLADLQRACGVVCTAGFTLLAECRLLAKPVLALPNGGVFEQVLNAHYAARQGWAQVCHGLPPRQTLTNFLHDFVSSLQRRSPSTRTGTHDAVDAVESLSLPASASRAAFA